MYRKTASETEAVERLRHEIEVLSTLVEPGVVRLVNADAGSESPWMDTEWAGAATMPYNGVSPVEALFLVSAVAKVMDTVHGRGWAHRDLRPEHIIVDDKRRVTVCSWGRAVSRDGGGGLRSDRAEIAQLMQFHATRLGGEFEPAVHEVASEIFDTDIGLWRASIDLDRVLTRVRNQRSTGVWGAARAAMRLDHPAGLGGSRNLRPMVAAGGVLGTVAIGGLFWAGLGGADSGPRPQASTAVAHCVAPTGYGADPDGDGCREEVRLDGARLWVGSAGYDVGDDGDEIALADLDCDSEADVLVLRPSTGEVFWFPEVPDGRLAARSALAVRPGASALDVDRSGACDQAATASPAGRAPLVIDAAGPAASSSRSSAAPSSAAPAPTDPVGGR